MPTPGRVEKLLWPLGAGIRIDSGIEEGQLLGTQFDSMLGKLIVHAATREQALARMKYALEETVILGLGTNQAYLRAIADHSAVREGRYHTGFLAAEFGDFLPQVPEKALALLTLTHQAGLAGERIQEQETSSAASPWNSFGPTSAGTGVPL